MAAKSKSKLKVDPIEQRPKKANPNCVQCALHKNTKTVCCVPLGPKTTDIMIVGGAMGFGDDKKGKPFVDDAGMKLNYLLECAALIVGK